MCVPICLATTYFLKKFILHAKGGSSLNLLKNLRKYQRKIPTFMKSHDAYLPEGCMLCLHKDRESLTSRLKKLLKKHMFCDCDNHDTMLPSLQFCHPGIEAQSSV